MGSNAVLSCIGDQILLLTLLSGLSTRLHCR